MNDKREAGPYHEIAEQISRAAIFSKGPAVILFCYRQMVEVLLHPHNREALDSVRGVVAIAHWARAHGSLLSTKSEVVGDLVKDCEAILDHLGVAPSDFERDVRPNVEETSAEEIARIERMLADQMAKSLANAPVEGPVN